jgi:predicted nucleic-acid-binding protein
MAKVINTLLQDGEMSIDKAKTIATLSNTALKSMELGDLADRMDKIEELLKSQEED